MSGSDKEEVDRRCEPDILGGGGTKNLKIGFRVTVTFWAMNPPTKLKVGFQVRLTLGNVPLPAEFFSHFWIKATLDYVRPLADVPTQQ